MGDIKLMSGGPITFTFINGNATPAKILGLSVEIFFRLEINVTKFYKILELYINDFNILSPNLLISDNNLESHAGRSVCGLCKVD